MDSEYRGWEVHDEVADEEGTVKVSSLLAGPIVGLWKEVTLMSAGNWCRKTYGQVVFRFTGISSFSTPNKVLFRAAVIATMVTDKFTRCR